MKPFILSWVLFLGLADAQYFSEGWKPGQALTSEPPAQKIPTATAAAPAKTGGFFDINNILTSEPVSGLFSAFGINISEKVAAANTLPWDDRIQLITDSNYEEIIVQEGMTPEEEKERIWALIITATAARDGGVSRFVDEGFDEAYNLTLAAKDLPHVRWGRIDYMNVTYLTTKWSVWQVPTVVILQDRGKTLRFFRPHFLRMRDGAFRDFLKQEIWKGSLPWQSSFAPGGDWEFILDFLAVWMTKIYAVTSRLPKWVLFIFSGSIASFFLSFLHRNDPTPAKPAASAPASSSTAAPAAPASTEAASSTGVKSGGGKKRGKK